MEWNKISISVGTKFLYLRFDVTEGDTYVIQLLDKIGIPVIESKKNIPAIVE